MVDFSIPPELHQTPAGAFIVFPDGTPGSAVARYGNQGDGSRVISVRIEPTPTGSRVIGMTNGGQPALHIPTKSLTSTSSNGSYLARLVGEGRLQDPNGYYPEHEVNRNISPNLDDAHTIRTPAQLPADTLSSAETIWHPRASTSSQSTGGILNKAGLTELPLPQQPTTTEPLAARGNLGVAGAVGRGMGALGIVQSAIHIAENKDPLYSSSNAADAANIALGTGALAAEFQAARIGSKALAGAGAVLGAATAYMPLAQAKADTIPKLIKAGDGYAAAAAEAAAAGQSNGNLIGGAGTALLTAPAGLASIPLSVAGGMAGAELGSVSYDHDAALFDKAREYQHQADVKTNYGEALKLATEAEKLKGLVPTAEAYLKDNKALDRAKEFGQELAKTQNSVATAQNLNMQSDVNTLYPQVAKAHSAMNEAVEKAPKLDLSPEQRAKITDTYEKSMGLKKFLNDHPVTNSDRPHPDDSLRNQHRASIMTNLDSAIKTTETPYMAIKAGQATDLLRQNLGTMRGELHKPLIQGEEGNKAIRQEGMDKAAPGQQVQRPILPAPEEKTKAPTPAPTQAAAANATQASNIPDEAAAQARAHAEKLKANNAQLAHSHLAQHDSKPTPHTASGRAATPSSPSIA